MSEKSNWYIEREKGWARAAATLRIDGWTVEVTTLAAPVQLEGLLPSGERFYFRSRHDEALLAVGGDDPADIAPWEVREPCASASHLTGEEGLVMLRRMVSRYPNPST